MPLELLPYQHVGAEFLAGRARAGLHDEMGVGKTAQCIRALDLRGARRGLVICPASLRQNWVDEFRKFSTTNRKLLKASSIHDFIAWSRRRFDVLILSYEHATKWAPKIRELYEIFDFVISDEAHYLKNTEASRTKAVVADWSNGANELGLLELGQHGWMVTGTPMANDPIDIYPFLRWTGALGEMSKPSFQRRYFHVRETGHGTRQTVRPEMEAELTELIDTHRLRRTKSQIGVELPPIFLTSTSVDGDTDKIKAILDAHPGLDQEIVKALNQGGLSFLDAQHIATLRRLIGEAKALPFAEMLLEQLHGGLEKAVVMGIHKVALAEVRDFLARHRIKAVLVNGDVSEAQRMEAVRAFQNDADCRVFIGNIRAAGVGLTLTAASDIFMLESDWTPAGNAQAIMRVHRLGQSRNVVARFIVLANSFDERVVQIVAAKTAAIARIEGEAMLSTPGVAA